MNKTTDMILLEAIQGLKDDIARIDRDMGDTRQANDRVAMAVNASTEQVNQFGKRLEIIERKIQDKMADVVAPLMDQIKDRKIIEYTAKPWYNFWRK